MPIQCHSVSCSITRTTQTGVLDINPKSGSGIYLINNLVPQEPMYVSVRLYRKVVAKNNEGAIYDGLS